MNDIAIYLSTVLSVIAPHVQADRRASIASDIAEVSIAEERAFVDDADGRRTALLLVSISKWETGGSWAAWIDQGRCNDDAWRAAHAATMRGGDCDGGRAWGMWQVHAPNEDPVIGRTYVADRRVGIRAALTAARESLQAGRGLCGYTGEHAPRCPQAATRLSTAQRWAIAFPFQADPVTDAETARCTWTDPPSIPLSAILRAKALLDVGAALGTEYIDRVDGHIYRFRWETHGANERIALPHLGVGVKVCDAPIEVDSCE